MHIIRKVGVTISTIACGFAFVPAVLAAHDVAVTVSGNGANSTQKVKIKAKKVKKVKQSNATIVYSLQSSLANTGGNKISGVTGESGDPTIETGQANATNVLTVIGGSNVIAPDSCGCEEGSTTVDIKNNGSDSTTTVKIIDTSINKTTQETVTQVEAQQETKSNTGKNTIKNITGGDEVHIETGDTTASNESIVEGGSNISGGVL